MKKLYNVFLITIIFYIFYAANVSAGTGYFGDDIKDSTNYVKVAYIFPEPSSSYVTPGTNIIIKSPVLLDQSSTTASNLFDVRGSISGYHSGKTILSNDQKTILFLPDNQFEAGETVNVSLSEGLQTASGNEIEPVSFSFTISNNRMPLARKLDILDSQQLRLQQTENKYAGYSNNNTAVHRLKKINELPNDFPEISVNQSNNPDPGYIFLSGFSQDTSSPYHSYLMILDNSGSPVFYKKMYAPCFDFKMQPNGTITYYDQSRRKFFAMNTSFAIVDSFACKGGYVTDLHELRVMPDGHIFMLGDDIETVDMSQVIPGGNPAAAVTGIIIQEQDKNRNVVFQWRSWDHFQITDATHEDLTAAKIDYVHSNAIDIDPDGNILLSSRHLDEITKININTGDIIWRLGGKNNQFNFVNDDIGFSHQHAIRRLPNGDIVLFDDGNYHTPSFSRGVEYNLDEVNKTATLVWQYRNNPDIYGFAMGYVQRLDDGSSLIGWGAANPSVTEVKPDGTVALELSLPQNVWSYRAYKLPLVLLTSLKGGETLAANSTQDITWNSSGVNLVNVDYSTDNGNTWKQIASLVNGNSGIYHWQVPATPSTSCRIKIYDASNPYIKDECMSDSVFTITNNLPVGLVSFNSSESNGIVELTWQTSEEKNNNGFYIQRKFLGEDWTNIAFVKSNGPSSNTNEYTYYDDLDTTSFIGQIYYRLNLPGTGGNYLPVKEIMIDINLTPNSYSLLNNYPNPFNPSTVIKYSLPVDSRVKIDVYNELGQFIEQLENHVETAGDHRAIFYALKYPSGVYFYVMDAESLDGKINFHDVKKMLFLK